MCKSGLIAAAAIVVIALTGGVACGQVISGPVEPVNESPKATGWQAVTVVEGLEHPWSLAFLPGGEILITERPGRVRIVENGKLRSEPLATLPDVFAVGQGGLMEVSLHPQFEETRWVYLTYSTGNNRENHTVLARGTLAQDNSALEDIEVLFTVNKLKPGGQHFGSRIVWLEDNTFLLAIGDGGNPPVEVDGDLTRKQAQILSSHLGKVLRLDENGKAAPANPFMSDEAADGAVYTYGHRNIQGMARHPETGDVWATEHGSRGGDELNLITPGANYGWPLVTYGREYYGPRITDQTTMEGAEDPKIVWTPSIAASGLAFYTGDAIPEWTGDLFAGGLALQQIRRIKFEDGQPGEQETLHFDARIRDVRNGPDGHLYVLTDENNGKLLRIEATE